MSNPVFTRSSVFNGRTPAGYPAMPGYQPGQTTAPANEYRSNLGYAPRPQSEPGQAYGVGAVSGYPMAAPATRGVTYDDVLIKTVLCFGVLLAAATGSWMLAASSPNIGPTLMAVGVIGALVTGLVNAFKSRPSPALILGYSIFEGLALGSISQLFESLVGGVVAKAVLGTLVTFVVMLVLFKTNLVRNSPLLMRIVMIGSLSYLGFFAVNWIAGFFTSDANPIANQTVPVLGVPLWVVVSMVAVALAALSLITDFDYITKAVESGAPVETSWTAAWGLMVSLVWLYLELLRLLTYFSQD